MEVEVTVTLRLVLTVVALSLCLKVYDEETGAFFYYNKRTGESQWTKPAQVTGNVGL